MKKQSGFVPLLVIVALVAVSIGGYVGFRLGDGTFFSIGVGIGIVLVAVKLLSPFAEAIQKALGKGE
ncbi:MAG: hypothetical protein V7754_16120 [Halioglobus sp.]